MMNIILTDTNSIIRNFNEDTLIFLPGPDSNEHFKIIIEIAFLFYNGIFGVGQQIQNS